MDIQNVDTILIPSSMDVTISNDMNDDVMTDMPCSIRIVVGISSSSSTLLASKVAISTEELGRTSRTVVKVASSTGALRILSSGSIVEVLPRLCIDRPKEVTFRPKMTG